MTTRAETQNEPYVGNQAHGRWDGSLGTPNFFDSSKHETVGKGKHVDSSPCVGRKHGTPTGCVQGGLPSFPMLPPSIESHALNKQASTVVQGHSTTTPQQGSQRDAFIVTLSGIPVKLCNDACLDAILWAAGVQKSSTGYRSHDNGHILINFETFEAADRCYNHFKSCAWSTGKLQVDIVHPKSHRSSLEGHRRLKHEPLPRARHCSGKNGGAYVRQRVR